jgi:hypothetical protein
MKLKFLLPSIVIVSLLFFFISCENDNSAETDNLKELNLKLAEFNHNYEYTSNNVYSKKKSWWEKALTVAAIATADAGGAAVGVGSVQVVAGVVGAATAGTGYAVVATIGGVVGAAGGSYAAYCGTGGSCRMGNFNTVDPKGNSVVYQLPNEYSFLNNYGQLHNNALENIYFSGDNSLTELQWIENNVNNLNQIDYVKLYNSSEFQLLINNIKNVSYNYKNNDYDYKVLVSDYKNKGLMNETVSTVLSNFFEGVNKVETFEDAEKITEFYVNTVKNSVLNSKDKEAIFSALTVYIQSYYYWYNFEIEE